MTMKMTMAEFVGLEPCPFCGEQARCYPSEAFSESGFQFIVQCDGVDNHTLVNDYQTEAEAIAAWNTRADYHGYEQAAIEAWESIKAWNSRAERTCECVAEYAESPIDGKKIVLHRCSACHELMRPHMRYCPNCGARRVGE